MADDPGQGLGPSADNQALSGEILEALEALPEERRREITSVLVSQEFHSGPLPSPNTFARYEVVLPGSAREIMGMATRQQSHEIAMRERALASEINYRGWTLFAATLVVLAMIVGSIILGLAGHERSAIALGAASGVTLVAGAFLKGRDLFPTKEAPSKPPPIQPKGSTQVTRPKKARVQPRGRV